MTPEVDSQNVLDQLVAGMTTRRTTGQSFPLTALRQAEIDRDRARLDLDTLTRRLEQPDKYHYNPTWRDDLWARADFDVDAWQADQEHRLKTIIEAPYDPPEASSDQDADY